MTSATIVGYGQIKNAKGAMAKEGGGKGSVTALGPRSWLVRSIGFLHSAYSVSSSFSHAFQHAFTLGYA